MIETKFSVLSTRKGIMGRRAVVMSSMVSDDILRALAPSLSSSLLVFASFFSLYGLASSMRRRV